ncbi:protein far1-related sequence 11-like isoform x1 [Gigaspora margarita]|uniref:Protein far1-related sequence 11-like isoform x1 n=1 Tax=Gigaspora margarita TaxID=4874 RepID=A0A8H4AWP8_GIGMA|nr:protein far1-related sequence 11-like isoform x1 [Gigaspora margarita]
MEQYFYFDENIAESSTQALFTSKGKEVKEAPTNQIHANSKKYNNNDMLVNKIMKQFIVIKYRIRKDKGSLVQKWTFIYEFGEKYSPNKSQIAAQKKFESKYYSLNENILKEVEIMTKHGNLSITAQRNILKEDFSNLYFHSSDLNNAI